MRIHHTALYTRDLEGMRSFYERYFGASSGEPYHNPRTGLRTYFLSFEDGCRLELMTRPELTDSPDALHRTGYTHLAFCLGSREAVDGMTRRLSKAGFPVVSGPRITGDGYYESCVLDPDGNPIELVE